MRPKRIHSATIRSHRGRFSRLFVENFLHPPACLHHHPDSRAMLPRWEAVSTSGSLSNIPAADTSVWRNEPLGKRMEAMRSAASGQNLCSE